MRGFEILCYVVLALPIKGAFAVTTGKKAFSQKRRLGVVYYKISALYRSQIQK